MAPGRQQGRAENRPPARQLPRSPAAPPRAGFRGALPGAGHHVDWHLIALALFVGAVIPVQAGVNARLDKSAQSPVWAAALTTVVALLTMALVVAALGREGPSLAGLRGAPWWAWVGGAMGSAYVVAALYLAPRLGAASLSAFLVCGQLAAAVALDHYGAVGYEKHPANWQRFVGLGLLVAGVVLVRRY